jgi:hypothetical protein
MLTLPLAAVRLCLLQMVSKRMGLLKLKQWYEQMLNVAKGRDIVADYQVSAAATRRARARAHTGTVTVTATVTAP